MRAVLIFTMLQERIVLFHPRTATATRYSACPLILLLPESCQWEGSRNNHQRSDQHCWKSCEGKVCSPGEICTWIGRSHNGRPTVSQSIYQWECSWTQFVDACPRWCTKRTHTQFPECTLDTVNGQTLVKEVYEMSGWYDQTSVPLLFDKRQRPSSTMNQPKLCEWWPQNENICFQTMRKLDRSVPY
jgi:hypothetical protein